MDTSMESIIKSSLPQIYFNQPEIIIPINKLKHKSKADLKIIKQKSWNRTLCNNLTRNVLVMTPVATNQRLFSLPTPHCSWFSVASSCLEEETSFVKLNYVASLRSHSKWLGSTGFLIPDRSLNHADIYEALGLISRK
jgi:hypothetical protein